MSIVRTEITLENVVDAGMAQRGALDASKVRSLTTEVVVDTGAWTLVINEETRERLGLATIDTMTGTLADGTPYDYALTEPVKVRWKDRSMVCEPVVAPDAVELLLGAFPLEAMDLIVHPRDEVVVGAHGDKEFHFLGGMRRD